MNMLNKWEKVEPGVRRKIFSPGDSIMMMKVYFEKGAEGKMHAHHHEQFTYVLKGKFNFFIEDNSSIA